MSLLAFAVRTCLWKALLGETLAGPAVENEPVDALDIVAASTTPVIAVFTDTQTVKPDVRSIIMGEHRQDVTLHVFLPAELKMTINGVAYEFQGRLSGAGLVMDLLHRQIEAVLMAGQSVWAKLLRRFVTSYEEVDSRAYVLQDDVGKVRAPARAITLRCCTLFSPPIGKAPSGVWAELVEALAADPDTAELGPLLAGMITGELLPLWRQVEAELGLAEGEAAGMGFGPISGFDGRGRVEQDQSADEARLDGIDLVRDGARLGVGDGPLAGSVDRDRLGEIAGEVGIADFYPYLPRSSPNER